MRHDRYGYVFALPFLACFGLLFMLPLGYAFYLSLFKTSSSAAPGLPAGLANYSRALTDGLFLAGVGRVALFFVMQVPLMLALALLAHWRSTAGYCGLTRLTRRSPRRRVPACRPAPAIQPEPPGGPPPGSAAAPGPGGGARA